MRFSRLHSLWLGLLSVFVVAGVSIDTAGAQVAPFQLEGAGADDTACTDDAMLVFDASGSMASAGYNELEIPRIHEALTAVRRVLPQVTQFRRIGLMVYGPGPRDACQNIEVRLAPAYNSAGPIIRELEKVQPSGNTPLTQAVRDAAEVLDYRNKPAVVVLVTDGDETCGGAPCRLAPTLVGKAAAVTVHVIGFKVRDRFFQWRSQSPSDDPPEMAARCLADMTGGTYSSTETTEELVAALRKTLGCPVVTRR